MGRDATISFSDVATAANKIMTGGGKPTVRSVREELGRGSQVTVHTHFKTWQAEQEAHQPVVNDSLMDPVITRAINSVIATRVKEATADITSKWMEEQANCEAVIKEYTLQAMELEGKAEALREMETRYATLTGRAELYEFEAKRLNMELENERKSGEAARTTLVVTKTMLEQSNADLQKVRAELDEAKAEAAINSEAAAVARAKFDSEIEYRNRLKV
jgi:predicted nuclease with TOPRIM domain